MNASTRDIGLRAMGALEALFYASNSSFAQQPAGVVLSMTYHCSKMNDGLYTFALRAAERGDSVLLPVGAKAADLRLEADGAVAVGFLTNVRELLEHGASSLQTDAVNRYNPHDVQQMAQDIMFHLCS